MCGRFVQIDATITRLQGILDFQLPPDTYSPHRHHLESYNVAPQRVVYVLKNADGQPSFSQMFWGIKPKWARDTTRPIINARSESIQEKPTFKNLLDQKIVVPADGFYEWKPARSVGATRAGKTPYYFYRSDGNPLLMAGIFQKTADVDTGEVVENFAILTTRANSMMSSFHDRMPVVIEPNAVFEWIFSETTEQLLANVTSPPDDDILLNHEVSTMVNSTRNDGSDLIAPLDNPETPGRNTLFD